MTESTTDTLPYSDAPKREWSAPRVEDPNLVVALAHVAVGLAVFPARVTFNKKDAKWEKKPCITGWQQKATTDPIIIRDWFKQFPGAVTGIELRTANLVVIDPDRHGKIDGVANWADFVTLGGALPIHPITHTAGGGEHHYFCQLNGRRLGNRPGDLPAGVDVRGVGGWIVAPGSVRPDGKVWSPAPGAPTLIDAIAAGKLAKLPVWVAVKILANGKRAPTRTNVRARISGTAPQIPATKRLALYARQTLRSIASALSKMPEESGRNIALNNGAMRMGGMVVRGWIDQTDVIDALSKAAITAGLDVDAIQATLASGFTAGLANPAQDPEDRPPPTKVEPRASTALIPVIELERVGEEPHQEEPHQEEPPPQEDNEKRTQAQKLIDIVMASGAHLFHSADETGYADIFIDGHRETWSLKSTGFRRWVKRAYYEETDGAPNSDAMAQAMGIIDAKALFDGPQHEVYLRVANVDGKIYIDLCDSKWRAIEIDENGWRIVERPLVRFLRKRGMLQIPDPVEVSDIANLGGLRAHVNVAGEDEDAQDQMFRLLVSWILSALRGAGACPILGLTGEQGTGKTLLIELLMLLIDPRSAGVRSLPRDPRDLYIAAINGYLLVFDNLSGISAEMSDCLCRLSTGGGFATRALYTDDEEVLFEGRRPIALTSINDVANRNDLADRTMMVRLQPISEEDRRTESQVRKAFEKDRPKILGALLSVVSHGLLNLPTTNPNRKPRMADHYNWVSACEEAMWAAGSFSAAYDTNRAQASEIVLDSDLVGSALNQYITERNSFEGTPTELLAALNTMVGEQTRRSKAWPMTPKVLSDRIIRIEPALRAAGITVQRHRTSKARRLIIQQEIE